MYNHSMKVLILGGNSPRHYDWIRELGGYLETQGHQVMLHDYRHWTTGASAANINDELVRLTDLDVGQDDYVVISKSIGTVITALGVARGILRPSRCVLLGIPYQGIAGTTPDFEQSLKQLPRTTIIQNEHDPLGAAEMIASRLEVVQNDAIALIMTSGDTHDYLDFALIARQLT